VENDEFAIHVEVADRSYRILIKRGDELKEQLAREAAKRAQQNFQQYRQTFDKKIEDRDLLAMTAIQLATEVLQLEKRNDTEPFTQTIQQLTNDIESYLNNNK
jgi:cell division protein ZapA